MFDSNKSIMATTRMWLRLARALDKSVDEEMKAGHSANAIHNARRAEACYWQATGEADSFSIKDVIS